MRFTLAKTWAINRTRHAFFIYSLVVLLIASLAVAAAKYLGSVRREPVDLMLGAYYYPWYYPERWTNEPVVDEPVLGHYRSDDRDVSARHLAWAKQAGLDYFIVSWLSAAGRESKNLKDYLLPEIEKAGFRFCLLYETPLALGLPAGRPLDFAERLSNGNTTGDQFVTHCDHLAETYLTRACYLRRGGRVVVIIYLVRDMVNAGPFLAQVRERLQHRGIDLYLIADVVYWDSPDNWKWPLLKEHFQAVTGYNMYPHADFHAAVRRQFTLSDRAARSNGLRFIPNIMPGYDDTALRGVDREVLERQKGDFYRTSWRIASEFLQPDQPFAFITSFNEWHEGTELEPSQEYGESYLGLTRELASRVRQP